MISRQLSLLSAGVLAFSGVLQAAPSVSIDKAIKVAQSELKERGLTARIYITSVTLEPASGSSAERWVVRWSEMVELEPTKREVGLEVGMDGSVARLVNVTDAQGTPVISERRKALTNHRTRSDRPSILDLKH